jgi:hypothetical protein
MMFRVFEVTRRQLPHAIWERAARAYVLEEVGFTDPEIQERLGISRATLYRDRTALRDAVVEALRADYTDQEIERTFGISMRRLAA